MENITHTPVYADIRYRGRLGIGCIRFKDGRVQWHTLAYGEAEIFFKHVQKFCAYRTYGL